MAEWEDDVTIADDEGLLRRVPNWPNMVKFDQNTQEMRPSSACFSDQDGGVELSITLETPHLESGGTHETAARREGFGLARVKAGEARAISDPPQKIVADPTPEDPHHGLIAGKKSKAAKRNLAKVADLVIKPYLPE